MTTPQRLERDAIDEMLGRIRSRSLPTAVDGGPALDGGPAVEVGADPGDGGARSRLDPSALENIRLPVRVELGRRRLTLEELWSLGEGQVVELDEELDEPVVVYVEDIPIARGEILVVDDRFCVRITELCDEARLPPAAGGHS